MTPIRFVLLGGFLGAGKTTTIARLASVYRREGRKVGIVTNDQAADLVDTHNLRSQGFHVGEVAGACFCCHFDNLLETVERLEATDRPDVILAEPVGSCTDLVATVIQPLQRFYGEKLKTAPYGVILKPSHGRSVLQNDTEGGLSPNGGYILRKQLEEADFVVVNRIDELSSDEVAELAGLLNDELPDVPILRMSAITGEGFDGLLEMLSRNGDYGKRILDIDYDIYALGEAELGWLNSHGRVDADDMFNLDDLLRSIVERLRVSLADRRAETAHIKAIGMWNGFHGVANLTSSDSAVELSVRSACLTREADVVVNARVAISPESLEELALQAVRESCADFGGRVRESVVRSLRPGRPVPTHRFSEPIE